MTRQEEVRDRVILNITRACPEMMCGDIVKLADAILGGESSQGVVIKVGRKLPDWLKFKWANNDCIINQSDVDDQFDFDVIEDAGYVAVEPLIEEEQ